MLPIVTEGKAQGDYRCIPNVSKQLENQLRLWVIYISQFLGMKYKLLIRCLLDIRDLIKLKRSKHTIV